ncbi:hypothetical protein Tco_0875505 [Tanacetum coccineum]|uniref:Uncharacterized protein n=1 Tax=Tanacetum coccineum TaxID=301880 RepID=A0ABQ5BUK6_9ASTR
MVFFGRISPNSFLSSIIFLLLLVGNLCYVVLVVVVMVVVCDCWSVPLVPMFLLVFAIDAACAFRAEEMPSLISCRMAAKVYVGMVFSEFVEISFGRHSSTKD